MPHFLEISQLEDCQRLGTDRNHSVDLWSNAVVPMLTQKPWRHTGKLVVRYFPLRVVVDAHIAQSAADCAPYAAFRVITRGLSIRAFFVGLNVVVRIRRSVPLLLFVEIDCCAGRNLV